MDTKSLAPSEIGNRFRTLYLLVAIAALVPFLTERQLQRRTSPRPRGRALKYLSDHWPDDQEWPTDIPRPKDAARDRRRLRWSWRSWTGGLKVYSRLQAMRRARSAERHLPTVRVSA